MPPAPYTHWCRSDGPRDRVMFLLAPPRILRLAVAKGCRPRRNTIMASQDLQVAIIGLGTMGKGMAGTLLQAGVAPVLWNRNPTRLQSFKATQARIGESAADAVRGVEIVVTMLTDADAVIE